MTDRSRLSTISLAERKAMIGRLYVKRDIIEEIRDQIDTCRTEAAFMPEPSCVIVTGLAGTGKTSLLQRYLGEHPVERIDGIICRPVLMVELPTRATMKEAATAILRALDDPGADTGSLEARSHRLRAQIKLQRVEVVLIDEFQHIVEASGESTLNKVGDWLKQQAKMLNIPFVIVGMPHSESVIDVNEQFARICPYRFSLGPFQWMETSQRVTFRRFLAAVDAEMPFESLSYLGESDPAHRIFAATDGNMAKVMLLLRTAAMFAIDRTAACIEHEDLARAFRRAIEPSFGGRENPFDPAWTKSSAIALPAPVKSARQRTKKSSRKEISHMNSLLKSS